MVPNCVVKSPYSAGVIRYNLDCGGFTLKVDLADGKIYYDYWNGTTMVTKIISTTNN